MYGLLDAPLAPNFSLLARPAARKLPLGQAFRFPSLATAHAAFPGSVQYADGAIDVFYRAGSAHTGTDGVIAKYRSTNKGKSWTGPTTVYDDGAYDSRDPSPVCVAPNGDVLLGFNRQDTGSVRIDSGFIRSTDGGDTWGAYAATAAADLGFTDWHVFWGRPIVIGSDVWVGGYGADSAGYTKTRASLSKSTDNGATWTKVGELNASALGFGSAVNLNEAAFYSTDGTNWVAFVRVDNSPIAMSTSSDGGATWTNLTFFCSGVSPMIAELADGDAVLFVANRAGLKRINCFRSSDGFKSATKRTLFVDRNGDDFGYPAPLHVGSHLLVPYYLDPTVGGAADTFLYYARRTASFIAAKPFTHDYENNNKTIDTDYAYPIANPSTTKPAAGRTYSMRINDTTADAFGFHSIVNGGTAGQHWFGFNATALPNAAQFKLMDHRDRIRFQVASTLVSGSTYKFRWYNGSSYQEFATAPEITLDTDHVIGLVWSGSSLSIWIDGVEHTGGGIWSGAGANAEVMKLLFAPGSGGGTGDDYHVQFEASEQSLAV